MQKNVWVRLNYIRPLYVFRQNHSNFSQALILQQELIIWSPSHVPRSTISSWSSVRYNQTEQKKKCHSQRFCYNIQTHIWTFNIKYPVCDIHGQDLKVQPGWGQCWWLVRLWLWACTLFADECEVARMRVSAFKSEVMALCRKTVQCTPWFQGELMPQTDAIKCFWVFIGEWDSWVHGIGVASRAMQTSYWIIVGKRELN